MARAWHTLDSPEAARLCLDPDYARVLSALMLRPWPAGALAAHLGLALNAAHHRVRRLLRAGLVVEDHLEPRRGRSIRHYRAVADALLIPYTLTPLGSLEELVGLHSAQVQDHINRALVQASMALVRDEGEIGLRLFREGDLVVADVTPRAGDFDYAELQRPEAPALSVRLERLFLTRADAKALQRDLNDLVARYQGRGGPDPYLLRVDLTPDLPEGE
ncbi:helix-turn-helix domain-containing protein [uncultured Deinococcus sp.]|uniref:helix-turn-helix domain-containing protein n=1 Tax=uncultured Deinococcus sp. TaxID=158789 RepID=UPI00258EDB26|nr:helix-turn-helix domain-containing protein [uncultured Deinococcus sp.]